MEIKHESENKTEYEVNGKKIIVIKDKPSDEAINFFVESLIDLINKKEY